MPEGSAFPVQWKFGTDPVGRKWVDGEARALINPDGLHGFGIALDGRQAINAPKGAKAVIFRDKNGLIGAANLSGGDAAAKSLQQCAATLTPFPSST